MPKSLIIAIVIGAVIIVGGGAILIVNLNKPSNDDTSTAPTDTTAKLVDPEGTYDFVSDPSVTKYPEANAVFGNGQTLTFEYDGSKTNDDPYATLSYQLYYIQEDGKVQPIGGGNLDGKAPSHGGMAIGLDRITMAITDTKKATDVIAFNT